MRIWPFSKRETRQDDASDLVIAAVLAGARGEVIEGLAAGVEVSIAVTGSVASAARRDSASGRPCGCHWRRTLDSLGGLYASRGEAVFEINADRGLELIPASTVSVYGPPQPDAMDV